MGVNIKHTVKFAHTKLCEGRETKRDRERERRDRGTKRDRKRKRKRDTNRREKGRNIGSKEGNECLA